MAAPQSIETVAEWSDVVVIGRPVGAATWDESPYGQPHSLITFEVADVLKAPPNAVIPDYVFVLGGEVPDGSVADVDHLLLLTFIGRHKDVLYATDGFLSIFANVNGRVVTPEFAEVKRAYGNDFIFTTALDGTRFDALVERVRNPQPTPQAATRLLGRRGYFAC
jgi:hypothetical protein